MWQQGYCVKKTDVLYVWSVGQAGLPGADMMRVIDQLDRFLLHRGQLCECCVISRIQSVWQWVQPKGSFARGVSHVSIGTALSQLIILLSMPMLTRLYTPAEFGLLGVFAAILGNISVVSNLRYEMAIPLPRRDHAAFQIMGLTFFCLAVITSCLALLGVGPGQYLLEKLGADEVVPYYWLLPVGVLLSGLYQITSYWAVRKKAYKVFALTRIQQGFCSVIAQIVLGLMHFGVLGLVIGQIAGQASGLFRLGRNALSDYQEQGAKISLRGMRWAAGRYIKFARYDTWAALLDTASAGLPIFLFAMLFGPKLVGYYMLSVRLLSAPITLFGKSISQVLLSCATEAHREKNLGPLVYKLMRFLTTVSFTPFLIIAIVAPLAFGLIFGDEWVSAGKVASCTALWVAFQFVYSPLSTVLLAVEAQRTNLVIQSISVSLRGLSIYFGYLYADEILAVVLFSVTSIVVNLLSLLIVMRCVNSTLKDNLSVIFKEVVLAGVITLPLQLVSTGHPWLIALIITPMLLIWIVRIVRLKREMAF